MKRVETAQQSSSDGSSRSHPPTLLVGVGGSAGSHEAFVELISHLDPDNPLAIIFVSDLDPQSTDLVRQLTSGFDGAASKKRLQKSLAVELLEQATPLRP